MPAALAGCGGKVEGRAFDSGSAGGEGGVTQDAGVGNERVPAPDVATEPPPAGGCVGGDLDLAPGNKTGLTLDVGGATRHYALQVPKGYDSKTCRNPLLVFLHGTHPGPTPVDVETHYILYARWLPTADQNGFLVALPVGTMSGSYVWDGPDGPFVFKLIDTLVKTGGVDPKRVYLAGFSSGGWITAGSIGTQSVRIAAFGVHGAGYPLDGGAPETAPRKAGVFIFTGANDTNASHARTLRDKLKGAGWVEGESLVYNERTGWGHEYDPSTNAAQWSLYKKFGLP